MSAGITSSSDGLSIGLKVNTANVVTFDSSGVMTVAGSIKFPDNSVQTTAATTGASVFTANIGNAVATSYTITHNLNKAGIVVTVREVATGYFVYPDIDYTSSNTVVLEFVSAPTANQYFAAVIG